MYIDINKAVNLLAAGDVVALPTETVYGLAAKYDAFASIQKIFTLKNRPLSHPLIVHIADSCWLDQLTTERPAYVDRLIQTFWPGPLTLVMKKKSTVSDLITAGQATVAIRQPAHPVCLEVISRLQKPVVAPSANPYCQISPTKAAHVEKYFANRVATLAGSDCSVGIESTIVLATEQESLQILRPGSISRSAIEAVAEVPCVDGDKSIKVPGNVKKHYAPKIPVLTFRHPQEICQYLAHKNKRYFFILINPLDTQQHVAHRLPNQPNTYAAALYALWHQADEGAYDAILIETPNHNDAWQGVIDRISKASA
jgi:L-threonylcarbamoyladenylate synthase